MSIANQIGRAIFNGRRHEYDIISEIKVPEKHTGKSIKSRKSSQVKSSQIKLCQLS